MDPLKLEIDEDELLTTSAPKPPETFNISILEARAFISRHVDTYKQFSGFPPHHPSTRQLRRTAAIYEKVLEILKQHK